MVLLNSENLPAGNFPRKKEKNCDYGTSLLYRDSPRGLWSFNGFCVAVFWTLVVF
jgi:hypothetical protein